MTNQMIPAEAVEAAAVAIFQNQTGMGWESRGDVLKSRFLVDANAALEAAAPHMLAEVTRERDEARAAVDQLLEVIGGLS